MKLVHYSHKPLGALYSTTSQFKPEYHFDKPSGFWLSAVGGMDWKKFCHDCNWSLGITVETEFRLKDISNVMVLRGARDLHEFTGRFGVANPTKAESNSELLNEPCIDWRKVAEVCQGIIIAPYVGECRMDRYTGWYYFWVCASGCIWDVDAIERIET